MANSYRTNTCGEITKEFLGKKIKVAGWVNSIRDHGGITFIDLREQSGIVQIVVNDDKMLKRVSKEAVISVEGLVRLRGEDNVNLKLKTGEVEVVAEKLDVLGAVLAPLPFEVGDSKNVREDVRLKYRYLDLRDPQLYNNIIFRSQVIDYMRQEMKKMGFMEIQTPIITASSPEGARDFIIPARQHPGKFYALPQSPQVFKQLLMCSGFEKYFQIAPCFRDEDARADRAAGEFYQLDMEMAFSTQEDWFEVGEKLYQSIFSHFSNREFSKPPFRRIPYFESMEKYGTDKPDLRNPLLICDCTSIFAKTNFNAFKNSTVKAICVDDMAGQPRSFYDNLTTFMVNNGSKGLAWIKVEEGLKFNSPIAKFLSEEEIAGLIKTLNAKVGSSIFLLAGKKALTTKLAGILRKELGERLNLIDKNRYEFCWITEFPLYELTDEGALDFAHNPFSQPRGGMKALTELDPLEIHADQWDLVCNGYELASGAVRNHDCEVMEKMFEIVGYGADVVRAKFGALYDAFKYGAPPHAGMAPGIDRTLMLLLDQNAIRDVIAFPLNKSAYDPLMNAPSTVTKKQLDDVHIKIDIKE